MTTYSSYTPDFKCTTDENDKGIVNANVGLITYDEAVYAGGYRNENNNSYYLYNGVYFWTMSPAGYDGSYARVWLIYTNGNLINGNVVENGGSNGKRTLRPVINLKANIKVTGNGTSSDPYIVES